MQAIIFTGLQANGKTTFYEKKFSGTHVHVNLDTLGGSRSKEGKLIAGSVAEKKPCVVDNTNLTAAHRQKYIELFSAAGYNIHSYFFNSPLEDCLVRNKARQDKDPIPAVALHSGNKKLEAPKIEEGFDSLFVVTVCDTSGEFEVQVPPAT